MGGGMGGNMGEQDPEGQCMIQNNKCVAPDSTGTQRGEALLYTCGHMKTKGDCEDAETPGGNPYSIRNLCEWIDADGSGDDSFGECIKTYDSIKTLCETDASKYGCPADSGCEFTSDREVVNCFDAQESEAACKRVSGCKWTGAGDMGTCETDTCALNDDFKAEMATCKAASCHNAGLATPKMCANYGNKCDMVEFKPSSTDTVSGTTAEAHCANVVIQKPTCNDKCTEAECSAEPKIGDLSCDWAPAEGQCKPDSDEDCYSAEDAAACGKIKGCQYEGDGDMGQCTDKCSALQSADECGKERDCVYEADNVCQVPKCESYSENDCGKHIVDSQCFWGVPGSCGTKTDENSSGEEGDYKKCAAIMDYDACQNDKTCDWMFPFTGGAGGGGGYGDGDDANDYTAPEPDTTKQCYKRQASFNCRGLEGKSECNGQKIGGDNICLWSAPTKIPEVVCFEKGFYDSSANDICELPNEDSSTVTVDGRDWGAQAYTNDDGGDDFNYGGNGAGGSFSEAISIYTTIPVSRGTKCDALSGKGCKSMAEWPFTDERAICMSGDLQCDSIPFAKVCADHAECEWNEKTRGLADFVGKCVKKGTADPRECKDLVCPGNCKDSCEWDRSYGGGSAGMCNKKGESGNGDDYEQQYTASSCSEYGFGGSEYTTSCDCVEGCAWVGNNRGGMCVADDDVPAQDDCDAINTLFDFKNGDDRGIDSVIKLAMEDACYSVGYKDGKSTCKSVVGDGVPYCQKATESKISCMAFGRSALDGDNSGCPADECTWCEDAYYTTGKGCYEKAGCPTTTTTETTSTNTVTTSSTSTMTGSTTTISGTTTTTFTTRTTTSKTDTTTTITTTTTETSTTLAMDAVTLSWDNPMCKSGATPVTQLEKAAQSACKTGLSVDDQGANDENQVLSIAFIMNQGKACMDDGRMSPCINTNKRCVTTECTLNRDAINEITVSAIKNAVNAAKSECDPRTRWPQNAPGFDKNAQAEGEEGWNNCKNFQVGSLGNLAMSDFTWAWEVKSQADGGTFGYSQGAIQWIAKIDVGSKDDSATLRTILGTNAIDFMGVCKAAFLSGAGDVDSLIAQKFEKTAEYASESTSLFEFGPGVNGQMGLNRAPGAVRFGEFIDGGDKYVYTTPAPSDEDPNTGGVAPGDDDKYDSTDGKFTMDEIAAFPELPADVAVWTDDGAIQWVSNYLIEKTKLREAATLDEIGDMVADLTVLASHLGTMASDIDATSNLITTQLTMPQKADGVQEELNVRKNQLRTADRLVASMKIYADTELGNKDFEISIKSAQLGVDGDASTADGSGGGMSQGTLIGVIVGIVVVLGMAVAVAFLVIKKSRGAPKQYRNHPTTQQNPAYEAPKGGKGPGGKGGKAPSNGQPPRQQPNVQQQGQRKVLVLDPYGNDA